MPVSRFTITVCIRLKRKSITRSANRYNIYQLFSKNSVYRPHFSDTCRPLDHGKPKRKNKGEKDREGKNVKRKG